ncbi:hypothetical protein DGo_CA1020 [Deinococcus gobiensis I-0]|uniref:Uncharacterized protein n=1 Tax=Deinococcus gobiensis (strain DSM 21396 / JCM 16679 / CGMCC 1.7299 / I-0) TaxID=745776 RepID=H8GZ99_DEIGI|nr:hypothetical protein DGo_CA1020 [Deinococcus gobiensis I-0]
MLDLHDQGRWARFVWVRGELRGGVSAGGQEVPLDTAMRALPRAELSLTGLDAALAEQVWRCRNAPPQARELPWPALRDRLRAEYFSGMLVSGAVCSTWEAGRVIGGGLPLNGGRCVTLSPSDLLDLGSLVAFWRELLAVTWRANPGLGEVWAQVCVQLAADHPVLDPFAHEVGLRGGVLSVSGDMTVGELRPALLSAYTLSLRRLGLRLQELPLSELRTQDLWLAAGLESA